MSFKISSLPEEYQVYLRKAEYESGENINGSIDTGKELKKALESLPDGLAKQLVEAIKVEIKNAAGVDKKILTKADYYDGKKGYNGSIDTISEFVEVLTSLSPEQATKFVGLLNYKKATFVSALPKSSTTGGKADYKKASETLVAFLTKNSGDPPNAGKSFSVNGKKARGYYHAYEDNETHIKNGGATVSETQVLCFNFFELYGKNTGNTTPAQENYNYQRFFMMPHDGSDSPQLPDSKLTNPNYNPSGLLHWLIQISSKSRTGSRVFKQGDNINYKIYDPGFESNKTPSIPLKKDGTPDLTKFWPHDNNTYKFGSALDADQWRVYGLSIGNYTDDLRKAKASLEDVLMKKGSYEGVMMFGRAWGASLKKGEVFGWKADSQDLYPGYQDPAVWHILKRPDISKKIVAFLEDAQNAFPGKPGLFMPVWKEGSFGWSGADPNTDWMGFQYRTFAHLAHYYYLTGDKKAKVILDKFYGFIKKKWTKGSNGEVGIPLMITKGTARTTNTFSPDSHGLMAQGLLYLAKRSGDLKYKTDAESLLDDLTKNRQEKSGKMKGSFISPKDNLTFGFHQCEVGIALSLHDLLIN